MTEFQLPADIEIRLRHLDVLDRIAQISTTSNSMEDVLRRVLDLVLQVFNADRAWFLYPCDPDAPSWSVPMERTHPEWPGLFAQGVDMPMDSNMSGVYRELLRADGAIQYGPDTGQLVPPLVAQRFSVKSQLMITLRPKIGKAWVFGLHHCASAVKHDEGDIHLFTTIAQRIADSLSALILVEQLRESEERWKFALEGAGDGVWDWNPKTDEASFSKRYEEMVGYAEHEFPGTGAAWMEHLHPDDRDRVISTLQEYLAGKQPFYVVEFRMRCKDGSWKWILARGKLVGRDADGNPRRMIGTHTDISERKQGEELFRKTKDLLQTVIEHVPIRVFWKDRDLRYLGCNTQFAKDAGHSSPDELSGKTDFDMGWKDQADSYRADDQAVMESGNPKLDYEELSTTPDGNTIWLRTSKVPLHDDEHNQSIGILGIYEDITERKLTEISLIKSHRALTALSAVNQSLVHATDEHELLSGVCQSIVRQSNYRMAWVGYLEHDEAKTIRVVAHDGLDEGYLEHAGIVWADAERGRGPTGTAARSGQTQVIQNFLTDERVLPWRADAAKCGYNSSIALPLINAGKVFGVLTLYSGYTDAFGDEEVALLEQMAGDLAFGILSQRTRHERDEAQNKIKKQLSQLESNLEGTIKAMTRVVELRDPYTAGHETRVAELAVAIAKEMGLTDEQVHGIHLAGEVHDLGKIQIPAEILSMPRRLTEIEYSLIKGHPQAGYDILKDIDFPWPIAQMVLQHHERIDGSGYPQGLKGDEILLEARILCVADVVEAMSSHRPYRPGLGIDVALAEISKQRGVYYDSQVVDACLALFHEQRFKFSV